jgi:alpha-ketoglutarate-dependent 2,4-dichlorophenoxyacetate dioxygenase
MAITVYPFSDNFVAEIGDVDLARPLSAEDNKAIKAAFWKYAVLVFPAQALTSDQHVAFAEVFGPLEPNINSYAEEIKKDRIDSRVSDVSNLDHNNEILAASSRKRLSGLANRLWHTDSIFRHVPARASLLYARSVAPIGGHTQFADLRAAWDALPKATKARISGLVVQHSIFHSRAKLGFTDYTDKERASLPPALQVLVRTIPESGRRTLYTASHAMRIMGLPEAESTQLLDELMTHATQPQFVHTHRWRVNDLVMWDNRCTLHRGTDYDERRWKRDMHRATVTDIGNTCETAVAPPARAAAKSAP